MPRAASRSRKLATYGKKRDFGLTPEPPPDGPRRAAAKRTKSKTSGHRFMIHKHDATRLHYDLRLEIDGTLASWAIPKGPSYDPAAKRLAVRTEDHPLAYGDFEGRIPDGAYGAGDSLIWEDGLFETNPPGQATKQLAKGHLHVALVGRKLVGEWHLVRTAPRGGKEQWLFFKAKDGRERADYDVVEAHPESVKSGKRVTHGPTRRTAAART